MYSIKSVDVDQIPNIQNSISLIFVTVIGILKFLGRKLKENHTSESGGYW